MSLLRGVARTMLASYFVMNGIKSVRHPENYTAAAQPVADRLLPLAKAALPHAAAVYLPDSTKSLVKATGLAQIAGGLSLATGIGRRAGAGLLAATMVPHVIASSPLGVPSQEREEAYARLSRNVALLGGVALASMDTEGRPNLVWKARAQKELFARQSNRAKRDAERRAREVAKAARRTGRRAIASVSS